jgi:hypothetical protein
MGETRVNLKHLLEDLRDSYPFPQEEAIITELIANALDSGASEIRFITDTEGQIMTIVDDGEGMSPQVFEEYHDIAATTKLRGKGIGFAGLGVKLALLLAKEVITQTKKSSFHLATKWKLVSPQRATWELIEPNGIIISSSGTAVSIILQYKESNLLSDNFIENVIQTHFHPILDEDFMDKILKYVYKRGVSFYLNGRKIDLSETERSIPSTPFIVRIGRRDKPVGIGFIIKSKEDFEEDVRGLAISTYGKVIKRGWDWIGISPRNPMRLTGIVEIPAISEILTTNKADFLKDFKSLQKYYRYRKAIQEAIDPILRDFGEIKAPRERFERDLKPLEREIERVLGNMLKDFPELSTLFWRRQKGEPETGVIPDPTSPPIGAQVEGRDVMTGTKGGLGEGSGVETSPGEMPGQRIQLGLEFTDPGREYEGRKRLPGVMIGFDDNPDRKDLGWLMENTIWINKAHPAFKKVIDSEAENYHIILSVSWVLAGYLEGEKSPQVFINQFLSNWVAGS